MQINSNTFNAPCLEATLSQVEGEILDALRGGELPPVPYADPDRLADALADGMTNADIAEERDAHRSALLEFVEPLRALLAHLETL